MNKARKIYFLFLCVFATSTYANGQLTNIKAIVRDSITGDPIPYVAVGFDGSSVGSLTDESGKFKLNNIGKDHILVFHSIGYRTKKISTTSGSNFPKNIFLCPSLINLNQLVVYGNKEKYSKKNNPAVELIEKVIAHKYDYLPTSQSYYQNEQYDHLLFALNDFKPGVGITKKMSYLENYADTSRIDKKSIVPISVRETLSSFYYRKNPKSTKRIIMAHKTEGLDQNTNLETLDPILQQTFTDVNITDDNIVLLYHNFVGPLSSISSTNFYKWYIVDTLSIDNKKYINLAFVPFNTHDVGFTGNLYVAADSTYALKGVKIRVPKNANINFVDEMLIDQEFEKKSTNLWVLKKAIIAMDLSVEKMGKVYVEKITKTNDWVFNQKIDPVFINPAPELYVSDFDKKDQNYWDKHKPDDVTPDYKMDEMMDELRKHNKLLSLGIKVADIASSGYIATSKNPNKNKLDLGTLPTFFSFNPLEGGRFRLTGATNTNFNKHLFLYSYLAYGTKDKKFKYDTEVAWSFKDCRYHQDEFPINKITFIRKYDTNVLGQAFGESQHDNILMSGSRDKSLKMTYNLLNEVQYKKEYYGGFSFVLSTRTEKQTPATNFVFEKKDEAGTPSFYNNFQTTSFGITLRYAPKEKFFQQRRLRSALPTKNNVVWTFSFTNGLKGPLGSDYAYRKASLGVKKAFWIAPYGRIYTTIKAEKIWGSVSYPLLLSPNVNTSYMIQDASFYMIQPLEFINDRQLSWDIHYQMEGWLFNRIPILRKFKWREIMGFRGFYGGLSEQNNPQYNHDLFVFPQNSYSMNKKPYMEASVGVSNILKILRIDYIRRFTYLDHPGSKKGGFRVSLAVNF